MGPGRVEWLAEEWSSGLPKAQGWLVDGMRQDVWSTWHANGQKMSTGRYEQNKKDGVWTVWDPSGRRSIEVTYARGVGPNLVEWKVATSAAGKPEAEGWLLDGRREGVWTLWGRSGQSGQATYKNGRRIN